MISISEMAALLGVGRYAVLGWTTEYREHLTARANPPKGKTRQFDAADMSVLKLVAESIAGGADADEIHDLLRQGAQDTEFHARWAYENSPLFGDPPDDVNEASHGALLGGMASRRGTDVARSYWAAARELLARSTTDGHGFDFPALFLVRHSIELYLKALLCSPPEHHDINALIVCVESEHGGRLAPWIGARLREFHHFDRLSDYFRYGKEADGEFWIDFHHLTAVMDRITEAFEKVLRRR